MTKENKWRKYEPKSLPPKSGYYLVYCPKSTQVKIHMASYGAGEQRRLIIGALYNNDTVTHWIELPEEPQWP